MKEIKPKIDEAIDEIDTNDDGVIDGEEYVAEAKNEEQSEETLNPFDEEKPDGGSDLGKELEEAAAADEDKSELDDLPRAGEEKPAEAAGLIAKRSMLRRGHRGHGAKATRQQYKLGFAEAMLEKAKLQQRLRHAMFLQHQRRLRHAALLHRRGKAFRQRK